MPKPAQDFTPEQLADALTEGAGALIASILRALPSVTEADGSRWVSWEVLQAIATRLETH
jgi:hypothetical protein